MNNSLPEQPIGPAQPIQPPIPPQPVIEPKKSLPKWLVLVLILIVMVALGTGAYLLGQKSMIKPVEKTQTVTQLPTTTPTIKLSNQALQISPVQSATYLQIPEYGVKFALSTDIKDAYYLPETASKGYVYLKVHSLDSEPYCNDNSSLGVAALNRVAKDEIDQRTGKKFSDSGNGSIVGNYYYFIDLEQAVCSQNASNQTIETNVRKAFGEASKTITAL
jgi:hypothetical protein